MGAALKAHCFICFLPFTVLFFIIVATASTYFEIEKAYPSMKKWCSERVTLRHVIALCIALDVRADIGEELVSIAGLLFRRNDEDEMLNALLFETKDLSVARANEIIEQAGLPRLTYGEGVEVL